jgi:hypothetical protein
MQAISLNADQSRATAGQYGLPLKFAHDMSVTEPPTAQADNVARADPEQLYTA